MLLLFSSVILI